MKKVIIVMGVSGCGKTSIGKLLASSLDFQFFDADDFHPTSNLNKLKNNIPLNDEDRKPWLETLALLIKEHSRLNGVVLACSALKESYRVLLSKYTNEIDWVHLSGSYQTINKRMNNRKGHVMKSTLLQSQFNTLEIPTYGIKVDIEQKQDAIVCEIIKKLKTNA